MNDYTGQTKTLPAPLASLIEQPHWVVWKWEATKTGKPTKVPYQARNPQIKAASDNPATWATSAEAIATVGVDGVGFVLTDTDIAAFDIDNCRDPTTSVIYPWALELVEKAQSYTGHDQRHRASHYRPRHRSSGSSQAAGCRWRELRILSQGNPLHRYDRRPTRLGRAGQY